MQETRVRSLGWEDPPPLFLPGKSHSHNNMLWFKIVMYHNRELIPSKTDKSRTNHTSILYNKVKVVARSNTQESSKWLLQVWALECGGWAGEAARRAGGCRDSFAAFGHCGVCCSFPFSPVLPLWVQRFQFRTIWNFCNLEVVFCHLKMKKKREKKTLSQAWINSRV